MFKGIKNKEIVLGVIGIFLLLGIAGFLFYSINFLLKNVRVAVETNPATPPETAGFNFQGLKELGIID